MYTKEVKLHDNEGLIAFSKDTGESREINMSGSVKHNPDVVNFKESDKFIKTYPEAWQLLSTQTTPVEYRVAQMMSLMVKMMTNSLEPLDDETTYREIAQRFDISIGKTKSVLDKLFMLGVYGKFDVADIYQKHTKYWVFNPYLAINGKAMSKTTLNLFSNTVFAKL